MSKTKPSFIKSYWFKLIIGAILMVGGMYGSNQGWGTPEFVKTIGLPLDLMKTIAVIGVFQIVFPVLNYFYLTPLMESIATRTQSLEETFTEAESLRSQMDSMKSEYETRLAETEADARTKIQGQIKEAQELRKTLMSEASAKADEMVKKAQEEIAAERDRALNSIRVHVANLTLQATEKVLNENMDNDRNRRLIDEFLDKVEVPAT